jgi:nicotinamide phosphoribosyltransferase
MERLSDNPITDTDSYKPSHWLQYPPDVSSMYSYFESRGGRYRHTVFFGLQYYLLHYLARPIAQAHVAEAQAFCDAHGEPFNREGWDHIVEAYGGRFPVRIRAVPEGTVVPTSNVLFDIEMTAPDPRAFWVVSWLETMLVRVWYPRTVATLSRYCKEVILDALTASADDPMAEIPFKLHDFGSRGGSSQETVRIGAAAHLVNFLGTDTIEGVRCANHYYKDAMAGFSIPAAEHSTMRLWGRDHEEDAYANFVQRYLIDRQVPAGTPKIAACVSDTWDVFNAIENLWCGPRLLPMIQDSGGKLVIRPDSGDPALVVLKCLQILDRKVGMRRNTKGFKVLPSYFGLIQGDGINDESIGVILHEVLSHGYSASNVAFGDGGRTPAARQSRHAEVRVQVRGRATRRRVGRRVEGPRDRLRQAEQARSPGAGPRGRPLRDRTRAAQRRPSRTGVRERRRPQDVHDGGGSPERDAGFHVILRHGRRAGLPTSCVR